VLRTSTRSSSASLQHDDSNIGIRLASDDYAPHKHPKIENRLPARPCAHIRHTPIYAFWLDPVERRFALLAQQMIGLADRLVPPTAGFDTGNTKGKN
jgi:hypothetical protein